MSVRKRNEFLDGNESDEELDGGYNSDALEESKGAASSRANKRRRIDIASDEESLDGLAEEDVELASGDATLLHEGSDAETPVRLVDDGTDVSNQKPEEPPRKSLLRAPPPKEITRAQKAAQKTGVVYISRVPPFMKPQTIKHFLAPHAPKGIGRVFLTPEDHAAHLRRVKSGGNKKKSFTDGWVEFTSKREAKIAAEILNGNIIGGKKGNFYHDDLWNMKYLKGFKWSHLTEQISNENAERTARMREEIRKTRQENKAFVADFERGKMLENMETKRKARLARGDLNEDAGVSKVTKTVKEFKQKAVHLQDATSVDPGQFVQNSRLLKMIL